MEKVAKERVELLYLGKKSKDEIKTYRYIFHESELWNPDLIETIEMMVAKAKAEVEKEWDIYTYWYLRLKVKFKLIDQNEITITRKFESIPLFSYYPWPTETYLGLLDKIKQYSEDFKCEIKHSIYLDYRVVKEMDESDSDG